MMQPIAAPGIEIVAKCSSRALLTKIDADIPNVRVCEHDVLALVRRVCQDLLVACQASVEHHLSDLIIRGPKGLARPH